MKHERRGDAMREIRTVVMLLGLTSWAVSSHGAVDLPFSDGFENQTNGMVLSSTSPWGYSQAAVATNSPSPKDGSILSTYAPDGMWLEIDGNAINSPYSNVWYHCYAKVRAHTNDAVVEVETEAAAFYVTENGTVYARSNTTWVPFPSVVSSITSWIGFSVQLDFENRKWNLYTTTNSYVHGTPLKRINTDPLVFNSTYPSNGEQLSKVEITGETYLDSVVLALDKKPVLTAETSPTNVSSSASYELILNDILTGALLKYFSANDRTMYGPFGDALYNSLTLNDVVSIYRPESASLWQVYTHMGLGQPWGFSGDSAYSNAVIAPTMAIYIQYLGAGERTPAFVTGFDAIDETIPDTLIMGTNATSKGWNALAVPATSVTRYIVNGNANPQDYEGLKIPASEGDRIYLRKNGQWQPALTFRNGVWVRSGRTPVPMETFPANTGFWYQRKADGQVNWQL